MADVGDSDEDADDVVGGLIGQQEHKPGKAKQHKGPKINTFKNHLVFFLHFPENPSTKYIIDVP